MVITKKLTDITSSEANLPRFSYIIKNIYDSVYVDEKKIINIFEHSGIKNKKVINRHLHILKILDLILRRGNNYYVSSNGKIIANFYKKHYLLTKGEKAVYFQQFFKKIYNQLFYLIETVRLNENLYLTFKDSFENNVINYFSLDVIQKIWNRKTLQDSIKSYNETGILKRGIKNKFETMEKWLEYLDLITKNSEIKLTSIGKKIYEELLNNNTEEIIKKTSLYIINNNINKIEINKDYKELKNYYIKAIKLFTNKEGIGDLIAINGYVFINLALNKSLYMDEKSNKLILYKLQNENIIRSFILNRQGKLALIQTSLDLKNYRVKKKRFQ